MMQFFQREVFLFEPQKILAKLIFTFTVEGNLPQIFSCIQVSVH